MKVTAIPKFAMNGGENLKKFLEMKFLTNQNKRIAMMRVPVPASAVGYSSVVPCRGMTGL
jgi:hypothetical protein